MKKAQIRQGILQLEKHVINNPHYSYDLTLQQLILDIKNIHDSSIRICRYWLNNKPCKYKNCHFRHKLDYRCKYDKIGCINYANNQCYHKHYNTYNMNKTLLNLKNLKNNLNNNDINNNPYSMVNNFEKKNYLKPTFNKNFNVNYNNNNMNGNGIYNNNCNNIDTNIHFKYQYNKNLSKHNNFLNKYYNAKICHKFINGKCNDINKCNFYHPFICTDFIYNNVNSCKLGDRCCYAHILKRNNNINININKHNSNNKNKNNKLKNTNGNNTIYCNGTKQSVPNILMQSNKNNNVSDKKTSHTSHNNSNDR